MSCQGISTREQRITQDNVVIDVDFVLYWQVQGHMVMGVAYRLCPEVDICGIDLIFPQLSPAAQSALYDVERFLVLQVL